MRNTIFLICFMVTAITTFIVACNNTATVKTTAISNDSLVKRGSYLVNMMGCDDCHSPKRMGQYGPEIIPELRFSGYPSTRPLAKIDTNVLKNGWALMGPDMTNAAGPWGVSFAENITSDATGIGTWSEEQFFKAIREGKYKGLDGSRGLLPPMPWQMYKNMTDDDIRSIFTFLKTTKPVENVVPAPKQLADL